MRRLPYQDLIRILLVLTMIVTTLSLAIHGNNASQILEILQRGALVWRLWAGGTVLK